MNDAKKIFDNVIKSYEEKLPNKSVYAMTKITNFVRQYIFYLYVEGPEDVFTLPSIFVKYVTEAWKKAKAKT